jgi:hypothetical protein
MGLVVLEAFREHAQNQHLGFGHRLVGGSAVRQNTR